MTSATAIQAAEPIGPGARYRWQAGREMYEAGRGAAEAEMAGAWHQLAAPVAYGLTHVELQERRWGPGGRGHFAEPRPAGFPGRSHPAAESEPELEASG